MTWNLLSSVSNQGSTFAVNVILANLLGRVIYGEYSVVVNTILSASLMAQLATGFTVTKYLAEFRGTDPQRAGRIVALCSALAMVSAAFTALLFMGGSHWLADHALHAPQLRPALLLGSGFLALSILSGYQMGMLAGLEAYRRLAIAGIAGGAATIVFCTAAARFAGLTGAVAGLVLSAAFKWLIFQRTTHLALREAHLRIEYHTMWQERAVFRRFLMPAAVSGFTLAPAPWLAIMFLARRPDGFSQVALYSAAYSLYTMVLFLPRVIDRVSMSLLNHQKGIQNQKGYHTVFVWNLILILACVVAGSLFVYLLGYRTLGWFGRSFASDGTAALALLLLAAIPEGLTTALIEVLQAQERMWSMILKVNLPRDAGFTIMAFFLSAAGATGLARAYLYTQLVACMVALLMVARLGLNVRQRDLTVGTTVLSDYAD